MNLTEFEQHVFDAALGSSICDIPVLHRLTATSVNLRIGSHTFTAPYNPCHSVYAASFVQ